MGQSYSSSDDMLEASLDKLKRTNSAYLDNQNSQTARDFTAAMDDHDKALQEGGMPKQAAEMKRAKADFQKSSPGKRQKIATFLARSLFNMTVKKLPDWALGGTVGGVARMLYDINTNGEILASVDTDYDGIHDAHAIDTDGDAVPDYVARDMDGDGGFDRVHNVIEGGDGTLVMDPDEEAGGGIFEALSGFVGFLFGSEE